MGLNIKRLEGVLNTEKEYIKKEAALHSCGLFFGINYTPWSLSFAE